MPDPRRQRIKKFIGAGASLLIAGFAAYVLYGTFQRIDFADVVANMRAVPARALGFAGLCVAGALLTLALYEIVVVRYVKHCIGRAKPMVTALVAFPLGHAIGQAMLSGGALRYRMYTPAGFSATEVGATVLLANMPYGLAISLLLDAALLFGAETLEPVFRIDARWLFLLGCIGFAKDVGYVLLVALRRKPVRIGGWSVPLPSLAMTALQYLVGLVDVVLVSSVLYLLLPDSIALPYFTFLSVYLASIVVGVLSHVPAGLGVLESMLLLLLPDIPPEQLLAAVLMYRVLYEVVPVCFALGLWASFEGLARDGLFARLFGRAQARLERTASPTIDSRE
jgi:uncharacterized membrane protein YbhN (UPF0104 family)